VPATAKRTGLMWSSFLGFATEWRVSGLWENLIGRTWPILTDYSGPIPWP